MTFTEQLFATLIGVFGGFMGSLVLFWIKEALTNKSKIKSLILSLDYELDYNIILYEKWEAELTKSIESVGMDNRNTFLTIDYQYIARFFAIDFYQSGSIQKFLHQKDMKRWNDFMLTLSIGSQTYILNQLDKWKEDKISKDEIFSSLNYERSEIKAALETTKQIKNIIKKPNHITLIDVINMFR